MIKITKSGKTYILTMMIVGVVAILYPRDSLYMITSIMFAIFLLSGNLGRKNIESCEVDFEYPKEIYANQKFILDIVITNNRKWLPIFLIDIEILGYKTIIWKVNPNDTITQHIDIIISKRGLLNIDTNYNICSKFPFGFVKRCIKYKIDKADRNQIIIFPTPIRYELEKLNNLISQSKSDKNSHNNMTKEEKEFSQFYDKKSTANSDIDHIRDYIAGDTLRRIDWKSSAKTDKLKSKEYSSDASSSISIDFDKIKIEDIEIKLSKVTYLINHLYSQDYAILFKMGNRTILISKIIKEQAKRLEALSLLSLYKRVDNEKL